MLRVWEGVKKGKIGRRFTGKMGFPYTNPTYIATGNYFRLRENRIKQSHCPSIWRVSS